MKEQNCSELSHLARMASLLLLRFCFFQRVKQGMEPPREFHTWWGMRGRGWQIATCQDQMEPESWSLMSPWKHFLPMQLPPAPQDCLGCGIPLSSTGLRRWERTEGPRLSKVAKAVMNGPMKWGEGNPLMRHEVDFKRETPRHLHFSPCCRSPI